MSTTLPPLLAAYVAASNAHDGAGVAACFATDGVVHDEGHLHRGPAAVQAWAADVSRKYQPTLTVVSTATHGDELLLVGDVAGTFPGSPVRLRYRFTVSGGKIASLRIAPEEE